MRLYEISAQYRELETLEASDDLPAEVILQTLDGLEGDLREKSVNVALFCENMRATATEIISRAAAMEERAKRLLKRAESLQGYLQLHMESCGISKIECPYFTLQLKSNPSSVVIDHSGSIPEKFWRQPEAPPKVIDKKAIAAAIKAGEEVPGAHTATGQRLEIRK